MLMRDLFAVTNFLVLTYDRSQNCKNMVTRIKQLYMVQENTKVVVGMVMELKS